MEGRIFEEVIEEDGEFADDGDESNFCGFVAQAQLLVKTAQDGVMADGGEGGHVEGAAESGAAAGDVALAFARTAVVIVGGDAHEGGHFAFG